MNALTFSQSSMNKTIIKKDVDIAALFVFDNPNGKERNAFMEEVGTIIFQSALMKYLIMVTDSKAKIFESFIFLNISNKNFVYLICKEYPEFESVLVSEIRAFQSEIIYQ